MTGPVEVVGGPERHITLNMQLSTFRLPPIHDALVIGKRAPIGAQALYRAIQEMTPGAFRLIPVEHRHIEAILVRESDLRRVPERELVRRLIAHAGKLMDATDAVQVQIGITVTVDETFRE